MELAVAPLRDGFPSALEAASTAHQVTPVYRFGRLVAETPLGAQRPRLRVVLTKVR